MKHTPGPWELLSKVNRKGKDVYFGTNENPVGVVYISNENDEYEETISNANLIAASPDLLSACKALDDWALSNRTVTLSMTLRNAVRLAREAINKAEGREVGK